MTTPLAVVIADDHPMFRRGLADISGTDPAFRLAGEAADGEAALALIRRVRPALAVLDLQRPGRDGLAVAAALGAMADAPAIVILTMFDDGALLDRALRLGARGYLLKDSAAIDLLACLHLVASGHSYVSPRLSEHLVRRRNDAGAAGPGLTEAERRILRLVADGETSPAIARALGIATKTVENHRTAICRKLGLRGPNALIRYAAENRHLIR